MAVVTYHRKRVSSLAARVPLRVLVMIVSLSVSLVDMKIGHPYWAAQKHTGSGGRSGSGRGRGQRARETARRHGHNEYLGCLGERRIGQHRIPAAFLEYRQLYCMICAAAMATDG